MIVAAKVSRLCDANPDTFDPQTQVQDAQYIINALNPRMKSHGRFSGSFTSTSTSKSEVRAGATNAGNVSMSFNETKTKEFKFGVEEYRIGYYVAMKYVGRTSTQIVFEHFWDRGMADEAFGKRPKYTRLDYDTKSLDVQRISIGFPNKKRRFACLIVTTHNEIPLWKRSQGKPNN